MNRIVRRTLPILGIVLATVATPTAATASDDLRPGIDRGVLEVLAATGVPGASIAVVKDGRIAYLQAYGDARIDPRAPARPEMRYSIGSISKQFTATAILMLAEEGKLSLDDPVARFLPDLTRAKRGDDPPAAVAHLGLPGLLAAGLRAAVHARRRRRRPRSSTGGRRSRSTSSRAPSTSTATPGTSLAGVIVEKASGTPLLPFLSKRDLRAARRWRAWPTSTRSASADTDPIGYMRYALGPPRVAPKEGKGWLFAAGELAMTAEDLARWNIAHARPEAPEARPRTGRCRRRCS